MLSVSRPFALRWSLGGFLSWYDWGGVVDGTDALIQSRWSYGLNGLYKVAPGQRWGFDVAANLTGRQGYPIEAPIEVPVAGDPARESREADIHLVDLGLQRELYFRDFEARLGLDVLNALNRSTVLRREVLEKMERMERMRPRAYRFSVRLSYR
jgi:hypothetical protein